MAAVGVPVGAPPVHGRTNGRVPPPRRPTGGGDDGDREPRPRRPRLDNVRLAMLFLMSAEVMFFAGLVSAFLVLRAAAPVWPPPFQPRLPVEMTGVNTLVLLASSVVMAGAVRSLDGGDAARFVRRLTAVAGLGAVFLLVQGYEWIRLVHFGLTVSSGIYGSAFYTLIGAHGAHVVGALAWVGTVLALARRGRFRDGRTGAVRACAMYWHFVVGLWPVLFVAVYLA
jgi:heme/copper-type cytochrome/quinol oxidase subunit 3